ncbi:helix-turn-helix domain-containing protein, partial [Streptomyces sp. NRRL F-4489]|uniref:helix-turn-helix domain-containing protein n=1 Tax=Streptomyces sp. NRRL F-4489 TaxID=1609095 RepID=UPI000AFDB6BE
MAEKKLNAPARAPHTVHRSPAGVQKVTEFQEPGYTIIGDHLAQHQELSLGAIGLAVYILSLPEGSQVDIRTLAERFPEGRERIASGLRELERHGYLKRVTKRLDDGRLVTVTTSYNNPAATKARLAKHPKAPERAHGREPVPAPVRKPAPVPVRKPAPVRQPAPARQPTAVKQPAPPKAPPRPPLARPR